MEALKARPVAHGIDLSCFEQGNAKSIAHLFAELERGEAEPIVRNGQLIRRLAVLNIDVFAEINGRRLHLVEDRQVFADGRIRRRALPASVSEKLHTGEDRVAAVVRALEEELWIRRFGIVSPFVETVEASESPGFPRLLSE